MSALPIIAISVGDPNGVGMEVILKTFSDSRLFEACSPVVYASFDFVEAQQQHFGTKVPLHPMVGKPERGVLNIVTIWKNSPKIYFGKQTNEAGIAAYDSLREAAVAVREGKANMLVTAPINKAAIKSDAFPFAGHTHYLASVWGGEALMILAHQNLRVALLTDHIPLDEVSKQITSELVSKKIRLLSKTMQDDFGCVSPKIALLGLNPHAGDHGVIGTEDDAILTPTIRALVNEGVQLEGPFAADAFFGQKNYIHYDVVLSCYHDQGLVGFKTLAFGSGVNITAGLPFVRTSPDHGTAFDIAGKGIANHISFKEAVTTANTIWNTRQKKN